MCTLWDLNPRPQVVDEKTLNLESRALDRSAKGATRTSPKAAIINQASLVNWIVLVIVHCFF